jgi:hypothetical protein
MIMALNMGIFLLEMLLSVRGGIVLNTGIIPLSTAAEINLDSTQRKSLVWA